MANFDVLIPNLDVTLAYQKRVGWKRIASVWSNDERAQTLKNNVRFVINDPKLPRIDPKTLH